MTRLRDDDFARPSHAAILRQQRAEARLSEPAHIGVAPSVGPDGPGAPDAGNKPQVQYWIVCDPEEPLRYI
jgi:hypothetical protein